MKVKVSFTVEVDYPAWVAIREEANANRESPSPPSPASCRNNIRALAEEAFAYAMEDYVPCEFVD